jgi:hypothetical protein
MTELQTSVPNKQYDLVSVLYHALQGAETTERYCADAENESDQELADIFRNAQQTYMQIAEQTQQLLKQRLQ